MKVSSVTDLEQFRIFMGDRIEDDFKLDENEIGEITAAIDRLPEKDRATAIAEFQKAPDQLPGDEAAKARRTIAKALKDRESKKLLDNPQSPVNKAKNSDAYMPSERVLRYAPNKDGVKMEIAVSPQVSTILDTGRQNSQSFVKTGMKYDSTHLTAYGVYDVAQPEAGQFDAGFKLKSRHLFLLGEANSMAESEARLYRLYTGATVPFHGGQWETGAFLGYAQGLGLGSRYSDGYAKYDLGLAGVTSSIRGQYNPTRALSLGFEAGGLATTGTALRFPDGTKERLDFSQNGRVPTLPGTDIPIDFGISSSLTHNEEHARIDVDYQVTERLSVGGSAEARTFALGMSETPAVQVDLQGRSRYQISSESHVETSVKYPVNDAFYYNPTLYNLGVQAGPNLFVGGHVGTRKGVLDSAGGVVAVMPDSQMWNVNATVNGDRYAVAGIVGFAWNFDQVEQRPRRSPDGVEPQQARGDVQVEAYSSRRKDPQIFPVMAASHGRAEVPAAAQAPNATFETVVQALQTPAQVAGYDAAYIQYDRGRLEGSTYTPRQTFEKKSGVCRDHSRFQAYVLNQHGYRAYSLEYGGANVSHSICVYQDSGGRWHAIEYGTTYQVGADSFESLAASLQKYFTEVKGYTVNWMEAELVTVDSRSTILQIRSPEVGEILDRVTSKELKY